VNALSGSWLPRRLNATRTADFFNSIVMFLQLRLDSVRERNGAGKRTAQINQEPAATQMASRYCCVLSDEAANAALRAALPEAATSAKV
jgi:hypothetical protein